MIPGLSKDVKKIIVEMQEIIRLNNPQSRKELIDLLEENGIRNGNPKEMAKMIDKKKDG